MKRSALLFTFAFIFTTEVFSQHAHFVTSGTVEYEKSVNMHAIIRKSWFGNWASSYERSIAAFKDGKQPQFKVLKSVLSFSGEKTLFSPVSVPPDRYAYTYTDSRPLVEQNNTIYSDHRAHLLTMQKVVYDDTYFVKDSVRKISWKITQETRDIAGFTCRRANGLMMDSIYVVAFFAPEIPIQGGPESFCGLPGLILGVALPHENMTWFATKVSEGSIAPPGIQPPAQKKSKAYTHAELRKMLENSKYISQWGKAYLQLYLKGFLL